MTVSIKVVFFDLGDTLVTGKTGRKKWIPGAVGVLEGLRNKGVRVGIVSNTADFTREQLLEILPEDFSFDLFEAELVVLSSEVNVTKPDPAIFRKAIERTGAVPGEALFVGENLVETLAAQGIGMRAARVCDFPADWETLLAMSG